jgi:hypothetical protein
LPRGGGGGEEEEEEEEEEEKDKNKKKFWEGVVRDAALAHMARKVAEHFVAVEVPSVRSSFW